MQEKVGKPQVSETCEQPKVAKPELIRGVTEATVRSVGSILKDRGGTGEN